MGLIYYIPPSYKKGYKELSYLEEDKFSLLLKLLSEQELNSSIEDLSTNLNKSKDFDEDSISLIIESVSGLFSFIEDENDVNECVDDVVRICLSDKEIEETKRIILNERLLLLLKEKKIYYAYKANDLLTENKNVYISSKVLTDLRPIFELNIEQPPTLAMTTHTLHIHYDSDAAAPHKDFYISLSATDIQDLMSTLIRAEQKEESLNTIYKKSGLNKLER